MEQETKNYLTREGLKKLEKELEQLKNIREEKKRDESVVPSSQTIDSEFATFQEDLNLLEARIEEIENILKNYELISSKKKQVVDLGATVVVEVEGQTTEFTIVGSIEANPDLGKISHMSPVGKALLGTKKGDKIKVQSAVKTTYKVKKIIYKKL